MPAESAISCHVDHDSVIGAAGTVPSTLLDAVGTTNVPKATVCASANIGEIRDRPAIGLAAVTGICAPNHLVMMRAKDCENALWPDGKSAKGGVTKVASWYGTHVSRVPG